MAVFTAEQARPDDDDDFFQYNLFFVLVHLLSLLCGVLDNALYNLWILHKSALSHIQEQHAPS